MDNHELARFITEAKPTLLEVYRPDCQKCLDSLDTLHELSDRLGDRANIIAIDGYTDPEVMARYKVKSYPAYILFKDGNVAWRDYGPKGLDELEHLVRDFI